jgi:hypothetical protein
VEQNLVVQSGNPVAKIGKRTICKPLGSTSDDSGVLQSFINGDMHDMHAFLSV